LRNLKFLVVSELWETETAAFWQYSIDGKPLNSAQMADIGTEVFLLPAACHLEKDGSVTNSSRWAQFRYKAVEPPGNAQVGGDGIPLGAKHEIWMLNALYEEIRAVCTTPGRDDPIQNLTMGTWWYNGRCGEPIVDGYADPSADFLDGEINGFDVTAGYPSSPPANTVGSFTGLQDDATTSAGNWLYTNMYVGGNKSKKRDNIQPGTLGDRAPIYKNWAWDWPVNRRIIYNGASLEPCGFGGVTANSWDTNHKVIVHKGCPPGGWDRVNYDVEDGVGEPHGCPGHAERTPFIMKPEGHCRLHGYGLADGPYPEHYEPVDTPYHNAPNPMGYDQLINPPIHIYQPDMIGTSDRFPIVATTYRCSEHWQAGAQTRRLPWQCELWPDAVVEMSTLLAGMKGINSGDCVRIKSKRGTMDCLALVTNRFKKYTIKIGDDPTTVHHIGIFWHWGYKGCSLGHSANKLTPHVGDANTRIPEYKAFLCQLWKINPEECERPSCCD